MKKILIAALVVTGLLYGCEKNSSMVAEKPNAILGGSYKYAGYSSGIGGMPFTPVDTIENFIQFDTANLRILVNNSGQQGCSTYTYEHDSAAYYAVITIKDSILYASQFDVKMLHDTLTIYPHGYADAFIQYFVPSSNHFDWCTGSGH